MSDFTYKKVFVRYSQSSIRGYCRPKFKIVRVKKETTLLQRIEKAIPVTSEIITLHPGILVMIILIVLMGAILLHQMIDSLLTQ